MEPNIWCLSIPGTSLAKRAGDANNYSGQSICWLYAEHMKCFFNCQVIDPYSSIFSPLTWWRFWGPSACEPFAGDAWDWIPNCAHILMNCGTVVTAQPFYNSFLGCCHLRSSAHLTPVSRPDDCVGPLAWALGSSRMWSRKKQVGWGFFECHIYKWWHPEEAISILLAGGFKQAWRL